MGADPKAIATTAMSVLDKLQRTDVNKQIVAIACLFVLMCRRFKLPASEVLAAADNLMTDVDTTRVEFKAAKKYMEKEWQD